MPMKIMGIDYGGRRIGVALSDEFRKIALPLGVVDGKKSLKAEFSPIFEANQVEKIVIGHPKTMRGESGPMAVKAENFALRMNGWFGIETVLWDERLTSAQADGAISHGASVGRTGERDMTAAIIILQSYLNFLNREQ